MKHSSQPCLPSPQIPPSVIFSLEASILCFPLAFTIETHKAFPDLKIYKQTSKNYATWPQIPFHFPLNLFFFFQQSILKYSPSSVFLFICVFLHSRSSLLFLCSTVFYHGHKRGLHYSKCTIPPSLSYPATLLARGKIHSCLSPYSNFLFTRTHFCTIWQF